MIAKCHCGNCGNRLEFEAEEFQPGTNVACPHCSEETPLYLLHQPPARRQRPRWMRWLFGGLGILLLAGLAVYFGKVLSHYPADTVREWLIGLAWICAFAMGAVVVVMWIIFPIVVYSGMKRQETVLRNIERNTRA